MRLPGIGALLLALPTALAAQAPNFSAAAVAAAACKGQVAVYLFARERGLRRGAWGLLGDSRDDDEPALGAALNGLHAETNCAFDLDHPRALQVAGPARSDRLAVYHLKLAYLPAAQIAASRVCRGDGHDQWVWIARTDLLDALKAADPTGPVPVADGEPKTVALAAPSVAALRQALADQVMPAADPCAP